jgi:hypothetical protein
MQIHEITIKKNTQVDEGVFDTIGGAAGKAVSGVKNVGSWIASPFKDVAQGYSTARQDQKGSAVADKAFRAWQKYVSQLEQSIAVQPAPVTKKDPPPTTSSTGGKTQTTPTGLTHTANANNPNKTATTPGATANTASNTSPTTPPAADATTTPAASSTSATTPAKPNYGAQTGGSAKVTYNQPTGVSTLDTPQPTNTIGPKTPGVTPSTPATVAGTAPGQPITVGGQKIKPGQPVGQPGYDQLAKATLKELQAPAAVSPALAAFRDRSDGKYEQYLTAFVQKNLLAGMGFKGLVNQGEITNAIKAIAAPENADAAKQRPLWNDLVRACALAMPSQGALTGRTPGAAKDPDATKDPGDPNATKDPNASDEEPPADQAAQAEPTKPTMTRAQISQWISRNSEDHAALKAALDAINAVKG